MLVVCGSDRSCRTYRHIDVRLSLRSPSLGLLSDRTDPPRQVV